jgi:hypothetical protein
MRLSFQSQRAAESVLIEESEAMKRMLLRALIVSVAGYRLALGPAAIASDELVTGPIRVVSVEVQVSSSQPVQVHARVRGIIGDSCTEALPVQQTRDGNTITLTLNRRRPAQAICPKIAKVFDQNIQLLGDFAPGKYVLEANAVEKKFRIP